MSFHLKAACGARAQPDLNLYFPLHKTALFIALPRRPPNTGEQSIPGNNMLPPPMSNPAPEAIFSSRIQLRKINGLLFSQTTSSPTDLLCRAAALWGFGWWPLTSLFPGDAEEGFISETKRGI